MYEPGLEAVAPLPGPKGIDRYIGRLGNRSNADRCTRRWSVFLFQT